MIRYNVISAHDAGVREELYRLAEHSKVIDTDDGFKVSCNPSQSEDVFNCCIVEAAVDLLTYESRTGQNVPGDLFDYVASVCDENKEPIEIDFQYDFGDNPRLPQIKGTVSIPTAENGEPLQMDIYSTNNQGLGESSSPYILAQIVL